ncbi:TKL protein kinase [Saprolegnia diclina VS20]|uniref:TKL protein kinase n=1 Tax=Saprolegnia diclina (strain VS20) TaxID=1156394 RepID=T0RAS1_SAPDV|nr:TKL protein kinase [Saprolegnia diclina VS20]EQC26667.1 TKL protein kinase [Saprolegnia diclina VS20]|eukprot:XP_008619902.1 TKL protein kinase [Saprolegnia diclina VS20]
MFWSKKQRNEKALFKAVDEGRLADVRSSLESGVNVHATDKTGWTPLTNAALHGHLDIVSFLLDNGATCTTPNDRETTPLHAAVSAGHMSVVRVLLEKGAAVNALNSSGATALHSVAESGGVRILRLLLAHGAAVDSRDRDDATPLLLASKYNHEEVVSILLAHGANADVNDRFNETPATYAQKKGHVRIARILRTHNDTLLFVQALRATRVEDAATLLRQGMVHVDHRDPDGTPLLHTVVMAQNPPLLETMLEKPKLEIDAIDAKGRTALAVATGNTKMTLALRQAGASFDRLSKSTQDAQTRHLEADLRHHASINDDDMVTTLLRHGVSPASTNEKGETALHLAAAHGHTLVVLTLFHNDKSLSRRCDQDGNTALHVAAAHGHKTTVAMMLKYIADVSCISAANHAGESPRAVAAARGHHEVVDVLTQAAASADPVITGASLPVAAATLAGETTDLNPVRPLSSGAEVTKKMEPTPLQVAPAPGQVSAVKNVATTRTRTNLAARTATNKTPRATENRVITTSRKAESQDKKPCATKLVDAVCTHDSYAVMALLADDGNPNTVNEDGDSLLHLAVHYNSHKVLDALLRARHIKVDARNAAGMTPMLLAIQMGHRRLAAMLQTATHSVIPDVSATEIEMDFSSPLGVGGYGAVYKGTYQGQTVAVKTAANASCIQALIYEMETMQLCNSPYVLQLLAVSGARSSSPKLILEFMDGGDLRSYLDAKRLGQPTKVTISALEVAWVLANALADLHHTGLLHRDLKSHNVLLSSTNYIKLADLGIAREYESNMTTGKGTPYWTAPEVLTSGSNYSFAADIYAFGVILTELDTLQLPFADVKDLGYWGIMDQVRLGTLRPTVSATCPRWLRHLVDACLSFDPTQRPSAQMLVTFLQKLLGRSDEAMASEPETKSSIDLSSGTTSAPQRLEEKVPSRTRSTLGSGSAATTSSSVSGTSTGTTVTSTPQFTLTLAVIMLVDVLVMVQLDAGEYARRMSALPRLQLVARVAL